MTDSRSEVDPTRETNLHIAWRDVPTVLVDDVIGVSANMGVTRFTLGEIAFNEEPGAPLPKLRPVVTIAASPSALRGIIAAMQQALDKWEQHSER